MSFWSYGVAVVILQGTVLVHEAGHYLAARRAGVAVSEFSIGFGPQLGSLHAFQTEWTLRAIPLGGYCRFSEDGPDAWDLASLSTRAKVTAAGPVANFALFGLLLSICTLALGVPWRLIPEVTAQWGQDVMGVWFQGFAQLFHAGLSKIQGTLQLTNEAAQAASGGSPDLLYFTAALNLNLGLMNLLPLPVLDGGRLLMLGLEWVRGRRMRPELEAWIYTGGAMVMLALIAVLMVQDVLHLMQGSA